MPDSAYVAALKMLGGRELSEAQVRQRLVRRGFEEGAVDAAIERLKSDGSIDDERVARMLAHAEVTFRKRGRLRVKRRLETAGIEPAIARRAIEATFQDIDIDSLIESALHKRLRAAQHIVDERAFQRLYRYLVGQGFEPDRVLTVLRRHKAHEGD